MSLTGMVNVGKGALAVGFAAEGNAKFDAWPKLRHRDRGHGRAP